MAFINIEQLRYYKQVCESRSLNKAAQKLFISQPALTKSIHTLEKELGTTLLIRDKRGVYPTETGLIVLDNFSEILKLYDDTLTQINNSRIFEHPLTIYMLPSLVNTCGNQLIKHLHQKFMHLKIHFSEILPYELDKLYNNPYAIAFTIDYTSNLKTPPIDTLPNLTNIKIKEDYIYYFASKYISQEELYGNTVKLIAFSKILMEENEAEIYCNNASVSQEFILNSNAVHPMPYSMGKLLYSHPDIVAFPAEKERKVFYTLIVPTSLLETEYQFVINEIATNMVSILDKNIPSNL